MVGHKLKQVWFEDAELQARAPLLEASTVERVRTVGKAMLTQFSCGLTVYSHNQLYGRWYIASGDNEPNTRRSLRFAIRSEVQSALLVAGHRYYGCTHCQPLSA